MEGEGQLEAVLCDLTGAEEGADVVDEHVDSRFCRGDLGRNPFHLRKAGEISVAMLCAMRGAALRSGASAASPRFLSRVASTSRAPMPPNRSAASCPIPEVAPVTTMTLPARGPSSCQPVQAASVAG